jgi:MFS family permease
VAVLISGNLLLTFLMTAIMPAAAAIARHFAGSDYAALYAEIVLVAPNAALIVGAPIAGVLIQRFGRRRLLLASLVVYALAGGAGLVLEGFWPLALSRGFIGLAGGAISTICFTLTGDYFSGPMRTRVLGWVGAAPAAGSVVGLLGAGALVDYGGWHAVFLLYLTAVPVLVLAAFAIDEPARAVATTRETGSLPRHFYLLYLTAVCVALVAVTPGVQLPFLLADDGVRSATVTASLIMCTALAATVTGAAYQAIRRRLSVTEVLAVIMALAAVSYLMLAFETGLPMIALALAVCGVPAGLMIPHMAAIAMERASDLARSRAVGLIVGAVFLGQFSIPFVSEPIRQALGSHRMFGVLGAVLVVVAIAVTIGSRFASPVRQPASAAE